MNKSGFVTGCSGRFAKKFFDDFGSILDVASDDVWIIQIIGRTSMNTILNYHNVL